MTWSIDRQIEHLERLLKPGVVGVYNSFEVTEVAAIKGNKYRNVLTLAVAEEGPAPAAINMKFLTSKPLDLKGTDWRFGACRYRVGTEKVLDAIRNYAASAVWRIHEALEIGKLVSVPPQFVPSDSYRPHAWNSLLKNNFWGGSHVVELFDSTKNDLEDLLATSELLSRLSSTMRPALAMGLDGMSDRLGNVLVQVPVTALVTQCRGSQDGDYLLEPAWHPKVASRPLRLTGEIYDDETLEAFASVAIQDLPVSLKLHSPSGGARCTVWDDANEVIVYATAQTNFVNGISVNVHVVGDEGQREFVLPAPDGTSALVKLPLLRKANEGLAVGQTYPNPREPWRSQRLLRDSLELLGDRREFVQYGLPNGPGREQALADIRWLLEKHGHNGAWLWDPFLDGQDVLETLFFCPHRDVPLRALTSLNPRPGEKEDAEVPGASGAASGLAAAPAAPAHSPPARATAPVASGPATSPASSPAQGAAAPAALSASAASVGAGSAAAPQPLSIRQGLRAQAKAALDSASVKPEGLKLEFRVREHKGWSFHDRFLIFPGGPNVRAQGWSLGTSVNGLGHQHHILQKVADGELIEQAFSQLWNELADAQFLIWSAQ